MAAADYLVEGTAVWLEHRPQRAVRRVAQPDEVGHLVIRGHAEAIATPTFQGGSKTVNLNLKPGTYKFFCSVPGHRMAGMEGTLVVK